MQLLSRSSPVPFPLTHCLPQLPCAPQRIHPPRQGQALLNPGDNCGRPLGFCLRRDLPCALLLVIIIKMPLFCRAATVSVSQESKFFN